MLSREPPESPGTVCPVMGQRGGRERQGLGSAFVEPGQRLRHLYSPSPSPVVTWGYHLLLNLGGRPSVTLLCCPPAISSLPFLPPSIMGAPGPGDPG